MVIYGFIVLFLIILSFILASIEDIKKREVYDYLNYTLTFFILVLGLFHSFATNSIDPIKYVSFGILIGFILGSFLYYIGIWGGGDAKFLIGFSAASYYLISYSNFDTKMTFFLDYFINMMSDFFVMFLSYFKNYLLIIDILFISFLLSRFFTFKEKKDKHELKDLLTLLLILFLPFFGLYLDSNTPLLLLIGFITFVIIFFANEEIFDSVYIKIKKRVFELKEGDKLNSAIKTKSGHTLLKYNEVKLGLDKESLSIIKENSKNITEQFFYVRKVLPYSTLITLNFIIYIFKILSLDTTNLKILVFLIKFLVLSFLAGGLISILIIIYYFLKNIKKVKINFSKYELPVVFTTLVFYLLVLFLNLRFIYLGGLFLVYFLLKVAKNVEKLIFVKKKPLEKVTLGDWIIQDIKVDDKLIYDKNDFKLGVNEKQLDKIKSLSKTHIKLKNIYVKDGIAFLPPLFIGFILLVLF